MALETYRQKRDFRRTREPKGAPRARKGHSFVVQKHAASHLHYDFRLELDGVLVSWAVPKGPSLDPADKRLAMQVEDHPVEYGGFEGTIPKGEYGGGTVMVWDRGIWTPDGDPRAGLAKGHLKFTLQGEKLAGAWDLIRTRGSRYGGKAGDRAWLLIKENDAYARVGGPAVVETAPDSVASGRDMDAIAEAADSVWHSDRTDAVGATSPASRAREPVPPATRRKSASRAAAKVEVKAAARIDAKIDAAKAPMPAYVAPMLATLVPAAPGGDDWIHEIKYDGYRMVVSVQRRKARLYSRNGKEWTHVFPAVAADLAALPVSTAWLDGEVVVLDDAGRPSFQALQNALAGGPATGLAFFVFDVMYLDGRDLRALPLTQRKAVLRKLVGKGRAAVRMGPEIAGRGDAFFHQACKLGLEGTLAKRADSPYSSGARNGDWRKVKCVQRQEMVIGGYTEPSRARTGFGALLLGHYAGDELRYAGKVGTGFDERTLQTLHRELVKRERPAAPFANPPRGYEAKGVHWLKPDLVAEIAFTEWSREGALRHPSFQGLRTDKAAREVVREAPAPGDASAPAPSGRRNATPASSAKPVRDASPARKARQPAKAAAPSRARATPAGPLEGITLSNPDKPYFPESGITKAEVAAYYAAVAPYLVPHLAGRPLSLVRCPDGWQGQCFYQRHADKAVNAAVTRIEVPEGDRGTATYLAAGSAKALVALVQWGVIEMHPWGSRAPRLDRPDRLIFDFDPDADVSFESLVEGVRLLRTLLEEVGLTGFLKTTGGKGLHVVVPIRATLDWDTAKAFARSVADMMMHTFPDRFVVTASKARRKGRIFVDYLRNAEGATAVAPYVVRARAHAPVAMPIAWEELDHDVRGAFFNVRNALARLREAATDPWADFFGVRQTITVAMRKRLASGV